MIAAHVNCPVDGSCDRQIEIKGDSRGESYRLEDKRQDGLLTSQHLLGATSEQRVETDQ